jgi:hypothetical protein
MIAMEIFTKGFYILGSDLTVDKEPDEEHISLPRRGYVRIEARFKETLPEPVTCILYAEFPGHIEIDSSRNVTVERRSIQINRVLTKHVKYFQGVYPIDLLASLIVKPAIIVTLDKHYMPCSHWVAICLSHYGCADYFDLYGFPPFKLEITTFLERHSISWTSNLHKLQGLTSNICGHYCCIYALHRAKRLSMTSFVNIFSPAHYNCNDIKAVRMFCAQFWERPACSQLEQQQL